MWICVGRFHGRIGLRLIDCFDELQGLIWLDLVGIGDCRFRFVFLVFAFGHCPRRPFWFIVLCRHRQVGAASSFVGVECIRWSSLDV